MSYVSFRMFKNTTFCILSMMAGIGRMGAQNLTEAAFINSVMNAISAEESQLPSVPPRRIVFSSNLIYAHGLAIGVAPVDLLVDYVDGLKAAGAQRVEFNPGVTSISDSSKAAKYDAIVRRVRQLGMQLAINPEFVNGEITVNTFQEFQAVAMTTFPEMAARYQRDNLVIVHEPTTMAARMGITTTVQDWDNFIRAVTPLIKAASPHTRVGAGAFYDLTENQFYQDFVTIPELDFVTMDIYSASNFSKYVQWAQLAIASNKGVYNEETWAPNYLPSPLPTGWQSNPNGLDAISLVGRANIDFEQVDIAWMNLMPRFVAANGMESVGPFTTTIFFAYGAKGHDKINDPAYNASVQQALRS